MSPDEELYEEEIMERYIILLLGIIDRPLPTKFHLQKELFILSEANPLIKNFINFEKHYFGPYSQDLDDLIKEPLYYKEAYNLYQNGKISITPKGKEIYNDIVSKYKDNNKFLELLGLIKMIRELYDKLTRDELLLLIYITYEDYKKNSKVSKEILSKNKRINLAQSLLKKGVITENRFNELVVYNNQN